MIPERHELLPVVEVCERVWLPLPVKFLCFLDWATHGYHVQLAVLNTGFRDHLALAALIVRNM